MNDELFSVVGKSVLVTGAASGIGRAIAAGLASRGARVTAADRDSDGLAALSGDSEAHGWDLLTFECDVSSPASVDLLVAAHCRERRTWDALFANAGIAGDLTPFSEMSLGDFQMVQRVNVEGIFLTVRAAADVMLDSGSGSIVLTSSVWGERGFGAPIASYAASKGAVSNLTRQLAVEMAPYGVRVNAILPAGIRTSIADGFYDNAAAVQDLTLRIPMGRVAEADVAVGPAVFLASEASAWVTGHLLAVDGGYLAL